MKAYVTYCLSCLLLVSTEGLLKDLTIYRNFIATVHNFYRKNERAADMKELRWDPYLQGRAEQWSENCFWDHQRDGLGENLAYFWTNGPGFSTLELIIKSCQNWWKEVHDWHWSTDCGQACHYTQMIWGSTERIGCALSKCASLRTDSGRSFNNSDFFVCFYDPPGNFVGKHPYTLGQQCTKCDLGETCKDSLCSKGTGGVSTKKQMNTKNQITRQANTHNQITRQTNTQTNVRTQPEASELEELNEAESSPTSPQRTSVRRVVYY